MNAIETRTPIADALDRFHASGQSVVHVGDRKFGDGWVVWYTLTPRHAACQHRVAFLNKRLQVVWTMLCD